SDLPELPDGFGAVGGQGKHAALVGADVKTPAAGRDSGRAKFVAGLLVADGKTDCRLLGDPNPRAFLARLRVQPVELAIVGGHQHVAAGDGRTRADAAAGAEAPERLSGAGVERVQCAVVAAREHRSREA